MKLVLGCFTWAIMFLVLLWTLGACTTIMGWSPIAENGYHWIYRTEQGIQATCSYTYMRVNDVEMWEGVMHKMPTSFMGGQVVQEAGLENLAGCVEWVEHHLYGGYYL
jgi:hypothetical protein